MKEYERQFLEETLGHLSASMANALREGFDAETVLEDRDRLTERGEMWVQGYLVSHLAVIRGLSVGNPNISGDDIADIAALVDEHEGRIASEVYS